jgi:hypothetical protein
MTAKAATATSTEARREKNIGKPGRNSPSQLPPGFIQINLMGVSAANGKEKKQRRIVIASAFRFLEMRSLEESGVNKKKLAQSRDAEERSDP